MLHNIYYGEILVSIFQTDVTSFGRSFFLLFGLVLVRFFGLGLVLRLVLWLGLVFWSGRLQRVNIIDFVIKAVRNKCRGPRLRSTVVVSRDLVVACRHFPVVWETRNNMAACR